MFLSGDLPLVVLIIFMRGCPGIKLLLYWLIECFVLPLPFVFRHASLTLDDIEELLVRLCQWLLFLST